MRHQQTAAGAGRFPHLAHRNQPIVMPAVGDAPKELARSPGALRRRPQKGPGTTAARRQESPCPVRGRSAPQTAAPFPGSAPSASGIRVQPESSSSSRSPRFTTSAHSRCSSTSPSVTSPRRRRFAPSALSPRPRLLAGRLRYSWTLPFVVPLVCVSAASVSKRVSQDSPRALASCVCVSTMPLSKADNRRNVSTFSAPTCTKA